MGYREVGSWDIELISCNSDEPEKRIKNLLDTLKKIIPPLKKLHVLEKVSFDLAVLGEAITKEDRIEEKEFLELVELKALNLDEVIPALEKLSLSYPKFIIPTVFIDLGTKVKIKNQELIYSESAQLYLGTNDFAIVGKKDKIHISYSTYIDVWLKEIFENWVLKDNTEYAKLNHPRLEEFLLTVEKNLGENFEKGESDLYSDRIQRIGFS